MNIKGLNSLAIPVVPRKDEKQIKSDGSTHDRDAQGQYFHQKKEKKKDKMTDEQFDSALALLNKKGFMTEMSWTAKKIENEEIKFAQVTSATGEVIRTISEFDMWDVFSDESSGDSKKGQLLKRTA